MALESYIPKNFKKKRIFWYPGASQCHFWQYPKNCAKFCIILLHFSKNVLHRIKTGTNKTHWHRDLGSTSWFWSKHDSVTQYTTSNALNKSKTPIIQLFKPHIDPKVCIVHQLANVETLGSLPIFSGYTIVETLGKSKPYYKNCGAHNEKSP